MKIRALILAALAARTAFGWSDTWETIPADGYHEPTQREWMELVWAAKERAVAAEQSECGFYREKLPPIWLGIDRLCTTNDGYLTVTSKYSDMLEQWIVETNAAYKDEFWEPSMRQQSDLAMLIFGLRSVFTATNVGATANGLENYWPWPEPWSNDVPQWVWYAASNADWDVDSDGYKGKPPMPWPWAANPYLELGGEERTYSNRPIGIVAVPVFEAGADGTAILQERHVLRTFRNQKTEPEGWFALVGDELPAKADWGIVSCSSMVFRFESSETNGWWSTNVFSFKGLVITTNPSPYFSDFLLGLSELPMGANYGLSSVMETNEATWSGTLPLEVALTNGAIPLTVDWAGETPTSTNAYPELTVELRGVRTSAYQWAGTHSIGIRLGISSWNHSWAKMKFMHDCLTNMGTRTVMDCRLSKLVRATADVSTNVCAGGGDCGDLDRMAMDSGDLDVTITTSNMTYKYVFETNGWEETGFSVWYYWSAKAGTTPSEIGRVHYKSSIGIGEEACETMSAYAEIYTICGFSIYPNTDSYLTERFPSTSNGTPRVTGVDIWGSVAVITNVTAHFMDKFDGNTIGWYPEEAPTALGSYAFGPDDLACAGSYYDGGWHPSGSWFLRCGEGIINELNLIGLDYLSDLQTQAAMAWGWDCDVVTNSDGSAIGYSRSGYATAYGTFFALADWAFATNFDARWDQYDAATNAP